MGMRLVWLVPYSLILNDTLLISYHSRVSARTGVAIHTTRSLEGLLLQGEISEFGGHNVFLWTTVLPELLRRNHANALYSHVCPFGGNCLVKLFRSLGRARNCYHEAD